MEREIKCKICGCVFIGIVIFVNLPICKNCLEHMRNVSDIIKNEPPTQMREFYVSGVTASSMTGTFWIE